MAIYFPVLRWKMGERHALRYLAPTIKDKISPVIEFPPNCKMHDDKIGSFCNDALKDWGAGRPFYLDTSYIDNCGFSSADILLDAKQKQLCCIPTYNMEFGGNSLGTVLQAISSGHCAHIAIRVTENVSGSQIADIAAALQTVKIEKDKVDLIVDMRHTANGSIQAKARLLQSLIKDLGNNYRQSILVSGAFTLEQIKTDSYGLVNRYDWELWKTARQLPGLGGLLYGDYATVVCEFRDSPFRSSPKAKYTIDEQWFCIKGHKTRARNEGQSIQHAAAIVGKSFYRGKHYSYGDDKIHQIANKKCTSGNATTWVTNDVNQHITFVVSQVSSTPPVP
ncbi:MAG: beta family protein [Armatimonadota bacterium]